MYVVTSTEEILLGQSLSLDFGSSLEGGSGIALAATSTAIVMATPSVRVAGVVSRIIRLATPDSALIMMDVVEVSETVTTFGASSPDVKH
ncbi:unnamed protein product [Didymodactylos carnosus]|uniref:Uncharacterized protein n=1 Tax=Didymodactylos carnosus TaxID=1234261 RepID=A0A815RFY6_9BILA|nr:unnamed protein product [Didymodactylos carnosus]CAF1475995.1 unnamed protein product [Didymodactylos carnosus]CAF4169649.1 unnamed protein product [Didymodactylos carnosus]CAF4342125.1 unnamed protein product [Didymodactylos carnosus]